MLEHVDKMWEESQYNAWLKTLDALKAKKYSQLLSSIKITLLEKLNTDLFSEKFHRYLATMHAEGVPFTDYEGEPANVSQIKKIINALYFGELALKEVEAVNLRSGDGVTLQSRWNDLSNLFSDAISHVSQAGHLATHLDVNFFEVFQPEIDQILPLLAMFQGYIKPYQDETRKFVEHMDSHGITRKVGRETGILLDQLDPNADEPDYEFLAFLGAEIPKSLNQLSSAINQLSSAVPEYVSKTDGSKIDGERLDELQEQATLLLNALEGARSSSIFLPLQVLYYIRAIRHTITLAWNIYEQGVRLNGDLQHTLQTYIKNLKDALVELCSYTDKIEVQGIVNPGKLSKPLFKQISRGYQEIIKYAEKFVDFSKMQELKTLEDSKFVTARLGHAYDRAVVDKKELFLLVEAQEAADRFFEILLNIRDKNKRILSLPEATKQDLEQQYKVLRPYVVKFNASFHNVIVSGLIRSTSASVMDYLNPNDKIQDVLAFQEELNAHFEKMRVSHEFTLDLNTDVIASISNAQNLQLFPLGERESPFKIDEKAALDKEQIEGLVFALEDEGTLLTSEDALTTAQALKLYQFYQKKCMQLEDAQKAYTDFLQLIESQTEAPVVDIDSTRKTKLRNLYSIFQPYLITPVSADVVELDKRIIAVLSSEEPGPIDNALDRLRPVQQSFNTLRARLNQRLDTFERKVRECRDVDAQSKPLELEAISERADYVIKHTEFSRAITKLRQYCYEQLPLLNESFQALLAFDSEADKLPFSDINDNNMRLAQSNQVVVFKQLFNCLYYLEKIMVGLEGLKDNNSEATYTYQVAKKVGAGWMLDKKSKSSYTSQVIGIVNNMAQVYVLLEALAKTPYLSVVITELQKKLQSVQTTIAGLQTHYVPEHPPAQEGVSGSDPLFYLMHTFFYLPAHINAVRVNQDVQPDAARAIYDYAERVTVDLERIIKKSDSSWKLSTEVFAMYRLFGELKEKLTNLTSTTYDVVFSNLSDINDRILTGILLELDRWEDNVSLNPGSLTQPVIKMFDAFYDGLLEPLELSSQDRIRLRMSECSILERKKAAEARSREAQLELTIAQENQATLRLLMDGIAAYKKVKANPKCDPKLLHTYRAGIKANFERALPLLEAEKEHLSPQISAEEEDDVVWLNEARRNATPLVNIEALTIACFNYYKGRAASNQFTIDTAARKINHLNGLLAERPALEVRLVATYAMASFQKKMSLIISAQRLTFVETPLRTQYMEAFKEYLQNAKAHILTQVTVHNTDIDKKIDELLQDKVQQFNNDNLATYHHLDKIMGAVARIRRYVSSNNHISEGTRTLAEKDREVKLLDAICHRECVLLKREIDPTKAGQFKDIMELSGQRYAVILYKDELFYADIARKKITKIAIDNDDKITKFAILKSEFNDSCKKVEASHSDLINAVRGLKRHEIIPERIKELRYYLNDNARSFKSTMYAHYHHNFLTFDWLKQTVVWLFELVGVYTPERKAAYHGLLETAYDDTACQFRILLNQLNAIRFLEDNPPTAQKLKDLIASLEALPNHDRKEVIDAMNSLYMYFKKLSSITPQNQGGLSIECAQAQLDFESAIKHLPGHPNIVLNNIGIAFLSLGAAILAALATTAGLGLIVPTAIVATAAVATTGVTFVSVGLVGMFASKATKDSPYSQAQLLSEAIENDLDKTTMIRQM